MVGWQVAEKNGGLIRCYLPPCHEKFHLSVSRCQGFVKGTDHSSPGLLTTLVSIMTVILICTTNLWSSSDRFVHSNLDFLLVY